MVTDMAYRTILWILLVCFSSVVLGCGDDKAGVGLGDEPDTTVDAPSDMSEADTVDVGTDMSGDVDGPDAVDMGSPDVAADLAPDTPDADSDAGEEPGPGRWEERAPLMGGPRQETAVVALEGEIYVLGGFNGAAAVVDTVEAYSPTSDSWRGRAPLPVAMHHANAAAVDGRIWIVGFLVGRTFAPDGRIFRYDPAADVWEARGQMPDAVVRGASAVGVVGEDIFIAGGLRGVAVDDFGAFSPSTGLLRTLPDLPAGRDHIVGGAVNGVFYVVGGRSRSIDSHTSELWAFDPAVGSWEARPAMPTPRGGHAAAVLDGGLYVFGGEGYADHESGVHDQAEVFTPATGLWRTLTPLRTRRHGTGAAALDGRIYLPGGADVIAFGATDANEVFIP
jgi:N-acetylneuraminic acid mutarotase